MIRNVNRLSEAILENNKMVNEYIINEKPKQKPKSKQKDPFEETESE